MMEETPGPYRIWEKLGDGAGAVDWGMPLGAGTRLGPYEIVAPIGAGGMGEVYKARDTRLDREVAVKVLPEHLASKPEALARFEREARAVAALSHPNILALYDVGVQDNVSYAVTELLEGETLRQRLSRSALPWRKAVEIGAAVADGLAAAHAKGITHRDLKPENLFLTSDGRVKILDFGLAQYRPPVTSREESDRPTETEVGVVAGTVGYMSPEQVRGEPVGPPSDLFSLGCVLYEMLTARRAFNAHSAADALAAVLKDEPPELAKSGKEIPAELAQVIAHCLEKSPGERFHSAHDLAFALRGGLRGPEAAPPAELSRRPLRPTAWIAAGLILALAGTALYWWRRSGAGSSIGSLAVLPFANSGGDPSAEYLSDGITETLINSFSRLPKLRVMARSLVFPYKGKNPDPRQAGRELNVEAVLTGRVSQRGETLVIQADLVRVADGSQLWGEQYNRKPDDLLAVQEEITREISDRLRLRLTGEEQKQLVRRYTANPEAYQRYLKGRHAFNRRALPLAIEHFEQALEKDPGYALPYTGIADASFFLGLRFGTISPQAGYTKAAAAALRALEIDDTLGEAHASLAWTRLYHAWDWPGAEKEVRRALELNPKYAHAQHLRSHHAMTVGRTAESLDASRRALEVEKLDPTLYAHLGWHYSFARRPEEAIAHLRTAAEMNPGHYLTRHYLGCAYANKGMYQEAVAEFRKAGQLLDLPEPVASLGHAYGAWGRRSEALAMLKKLDELSAQRYVSPYYRALVWAGLDDKNQAIEWLEKAYRERAAFLHELNREPRLDNLRSDLRFQALVRRIGLPP